MKRVKRDEKSDAALVARVPEKELKITATPSSDGTNSCAFLSLGVIDALINNGFIDNTQNPFVTRTSDIMDNFPEQLNKYRTLKDLADIYEANDILNTNNLLHSKLQFSEKIMKNERIYSHDL